MTRAPDLEIYVDQIDVEQSITWLSQLFSKVAKTKKVKGMPKQSFPFVFEHDHQQYEGVIYDKVSDGFTSIWLNSDQLPWQDDLALAKLAAEQLSKEVRVTQGGWGPEDNPDAWLRILPDGSTSEIIWKS